MVGSAFAVTKVLFAGLSSSCRPGVEQAIRQELLKVSCPEGGIKEEQQEGRGLNWARDDVGGSPLSRLRFNLRPSHLSRPCELEVLTSRLAPDRNLECNAWMAAFG